MAVDGGLYGFQRSINKQTPQHYNNMETYIMSQLVGKTMFAIVQHYDKISMYCEDGRIYTLIHEQDCCETVVLDDVSGDLSDLEGSPLLVCEETTSTDVNPDYESATWTFYRFATVKGWANMRWHGSSNGYYSESVSLVVDQENTSEWRDMRLQKLGIN